MIIQVKQKILVAMSGGVDSAVVAALLKSQGNEVIGLHLNLGNFDSKEKEKKTKNISNSLGIELKVIDVSKIFKQEIIKYFVDSYEYGFTPNPCIVCNKKIKFDFLIREMRHLGCDFAATGHYCKIKNQKVKSKNIFKLLKAKDETKDQSYFLYALTQHQISKLIFPLSEYAKYDVKKMAKNLELATDEESFDVCFLAGVSCGDFLKKNIKAKVGKIRDIGGKILGEHKGLFLYTVGQRRGIEIGGTGPYYVIRKDYGTNELIVSNNEQDISLYKDSLVAYDVNWVSGTSPKFPLKCRARIRYQGDLQNCVVSQKRGNEAVLVQFSKPQKAIASGQSIVFYKGREVLGGGVIES